MHPYLLTFLPTEILTELTKYEESHKDKLNNYLTENNEKHSETTEPIGLLYSEKTK